jgi:hypothetical protein
MGCWIRARVGVGNDNYIQNSGNMRIGTVLYRLHLTIAYGVFKVPDFIEASYRYFLDSDFASLRIVI